MSPTVTDVVVMIAGVENFAGSLTETLSVFGEPDIATLSCSTFIVIWLVYAPAEKPYIVHVFDALPPTEIVCEPVLSLRLRVVAFKLNPPLALVKSASIVMPD